MVVVADGRLGYGQRARERDNNYGLQAAGVGSAGIIPGGQPSAYKHPR